MIIEELNSKNIIYIYSDEGASSFCIENCKRSIYAMEVQPYVIKEINAEQVINGAWRQNALAFIMPGGADLLYCKKLNGPGNLQIKVYVENGGVYIGFCAGAYYGASYCNFHHSSFYRGDKRGYEVLSERELSFFPDEAIGPILAPYDYLSKSGSRIAYIKWVEKNARNEKLYNVYFNGGCYFKDAHQYSNVCVLATYNNENFQNLPAIIECYIGNGKALLCGAHPECSLEDLKKENISKKDLNHLNTTIFPKLKDCSHKKLFKLLIERIR